MAVWRGRLEGSKRKSGALRGEWAPVRMAVVGVQAVRYQELCDFRPALKAGSVHWGVPVLFSDAGVRSFLQKKLDCRRLAREDRVHQRCLTTLTD